jgi:hypothetical protein
MFKRIETDNAVIVKGGVFKTADVYEFQGGLYLKAGGGFVRVKMNGATSVDGLSLHTLMRESGELYADQFGRLCLEDGPNRTHVALGLAGPGGDERTVLLLYKA